MKIVFWSPLHGQCCATSNMLAVALLAAAAYNKKTIITHSHYNLNNLEVPLIGRIEENEFFKDTGLDALIRCMKSQAITEELLERHVVPVVKEKMSLLAGTRQRSRDIFEADTAKLMAKVMHVIDQYYDLVFVDSNSGMGGITGDVVENADVMVVNLRQNEEMLKQYFQNNHEWVETRCKNIFYLFGAYDEESRYSLYNLRRRYKPFSKKNTGGVPYNIDFSDALSNGSLVRYFLSNQNLDEDNFQSGFYREVYKSADKILKMTGFRAAERSQEFEQPD